jgi:pimeloyl-ACP methyl ester carboxylesterase
MGEIPGKDGEGMMKVFKSEAGMRALMESYDRLVASWGVATEERDLETSYGTTHVILAGSTDNPPLVMFHGVGDNSALMWVYNARELSRHFRLVAVDTMGGAGKSRPDGRYKKGFDLAHWYGNVLDALDIKKAYATGVSYGSYHAQLLLISFPGRVERIVGMAGGLSIKGSGSSGISQIVRMMRIFLPEALFPTERNVRKLYTKMDRNGADALLGNAELFKHFQLLLKHYNQQAQMFHNRRPFEEREIAAMRDKALFLIGDTDPFARLSDPFPQLRDHGMSFKVVAGAGHALNHTRPREMEAEIVRFCLGKA